MILPVGDVANRCHELDSHVKYTFRSIFFIKIECKYCIISTEGCRFNGLYRANKTITSNGYYDETHFVYIKYIRDIKQDFYYIILILEYMSNKKECISM